MEKKNGLPNQSDEVLQQTQRILSWSAYQESLRDVDQKVLDQFQATITSLRRTIWVRSGIYLIQFLVIALILIWSLQQAMTIDQSERWWIWSIAIGSLLMLAILLFRNPLPSISHHLVDLARIQIILQGYSRQINQVDASFKQMLLEDKIEARGLEKSIRQIQIIIDGNVESLLQFLEEMHL